MLGDRHYNIEVPKEGLPYRQAAYRAADQESDPKLREGLLTAEECWWRGKTLYPGETAEGVFKNDGRKAFIHAKPWKEEDEKDSTFKWTPTKEKINAS